MHFKDMKKMQVAHKTITLRNKNTNVVIEGIANIDGDIAMMCLGLLNKKAIDVAEIQCVVNNPKLPTWKVSKDFNDIYKKAIAKAISDMASDLRKECMLYGGL